MPITKYLYVYILECSDLTYYTGITNNIERRMQEHHSGINSKSYTSMRLPMKLVYNEKFTDYNLALAWEKKIKKWSKIKKDALINNNWNQLKIASECNNDTSSKKYKIEK